MTAMTRCIVLVLMLALLASCAHLSPSTDKATQDPATAPNAAASPALPEETVSATEQTPAGSPAIEAAGEEGASSSKKLTEEPLSPEQKTQAILDEALDYCQASQDFWQIGELENALEALDQAYALILNVDTEDVPKLIQQKEDLRFMISKRILEIYASRNIVVNGNHKAIPLELNKHVQMELKRFTVGPEKAFFRESYQRSGRYRPMIVAALKEAGLPEELSWLPLIESGFKIRALSRARALGLWQFIPSTGYKFGLKRDMFIDERLDPFKATHAAIDYLQELHQIFGDWTTVLAAYNCGEGRVLRVIRTQNVNYLDNFWDLYERLPRETARYVPRFLATLFILKDPHKYGLDQIALDPPMEFDTVTVARQVHLKPLAAKLGVQETVLYDLNPELRHKILPADTFTLRVPPQTTDGVLASIDQIPVHSPPQRAYVYHRVHRGETLSTIARRYRTNVKSIALANNIRKKHLIRVGQRLKIPKKGYVSYPVAASGSKGSTQATMHVVRRGDSLWNIAKRYGTTTKRIQALNNLSSSTLYIGQIIQLTNQKTSASAKTYRVQRGDSPFKIANKNDMPLQRLLQINQLTAGSKIYPGQLLLVE